jgi:hypothetical protein
MDYEITVLETVRDATELADAERWWIAFGRACGWPLTNLTSGGGLSEDAILEKRRRRAAWEAAEAARVRRVFSPEDIEASRHYINNRFGIPAELERRCLLFFNKRYTRGLRGIALIDDVITNLCVTRGTATQLYDKWSLARVAKQGRVRNRRPIEATGLGRIRQHLSDHPAVVKAHCFLLFEIYDADATDQLGRVEPSRSDRYRWVVDVADEARVTLGAAEELFEEWLERSGRVRIGAARTTRTRWIVS